MPFLLASMVLIVLVAGLVVAYVAYPHRGRDLPAAPWLGEALRRGVDALPTVGDGEREGEARVPAQRAGAAAPPARR